METQYMPLPVKISGHRVIPVTFAGFIHIAVYGVNVIIIALALWLYWSG
jgi:hypothetical protein